LPDFTEPAPNNSIAPKAKVADPTAAEVSRDTAEVDTEQTPAPEPEKWQPVAGKQAIANLTANGKGRLVKVLQVQPDGGATVRFLDNDQTRYVPAAQLRATKADASRALRAAELAGVADPKQVKLDAAEFDRLTKEYAPRLGLLDAQAFDPAVLRGDGIVNDRLVKQARSNLARAAGIVGFQENMPTDKAKALPAVKAYLAAKFPATPAKNPLTPPATGATIPEAIHEKHQAIHRAAERSSRANLRTSGQLDDVRLRAESATRRLHQSAPEAFVAVQPDPDYATTDHGRQLQAVAQSQGTEVHFYQGPRTSPKGVFFEGRLFLKSNRTAAEITETFEHELAHHLSAQGNPQLSRLAALVDIHSPSAMEFRARYEHWLVARGLDPLTDALLTEELAADAASGARTFAAVDSLAAFPDQSEAIQLVTEYHQQTAKYSPGSEFSFDAPESVLDQKTRLARERGAKAAEEAKGALAVRAAVKLTGKDLDTSKEMFGAEVRQDKAGQGSLFSPDANSPSLEMDKAADLPESVNVKVEGTDPKTGDVVVREMSARRAGQWLTGKMDMLRRLLDCLEGKTHGT
jgi:hypothetical protein